MQSETGFPSSHQLKSYVASKFRLKSAARAVLSADAGLLVKPGVGLPICGTGIASIEIWRMETPKLVVVRVTDKCLDSGPVFFL